MTAFFGWCKDWSGVFALVISIVAAFYGFRRAKAADDANEIMVGNPWVTLLMSFISEELKSVQADRDVFQRICKVPFENAENKQKAMKELYDLRDASSRRLYFLADLAPSAKPLTALQAAVNQIDDSYWGNEALSLPQQNADSLLRQYQKTAGEYACAIRDFAKVRKNFR